MPFTLLHWPMPLLICEILFHERSNRLRVQIISIILVSLPDIEGFSYYYLHLPVKTHGFLHSILGSILLPLFFLTFSFLVMKLLDAKGITILFTKKEITLFLLIPLVFHLGLDVFMHPDIELWYPFLNEKNPYTSVQILNYIYFLSFLSLLQIIIFVQFRIFFYYKNRNRTFI